MMQGKWSAKIGRRACLWLTSNCVCFAPQPSVLLLNQVLRFRYLKQASWMNIAVVCCHRINNRSETRSFLVKSCSASYYCLRRRVIIKLNRFSREVGIVGTPPIPCASLLPLPPFREDPLALRNLGTFRRRWLVRDAWWCIEQHTFPWPRRIVAG